MPPKVTWLGDQLVDRIPTMVVSRVGNFIGVEQVDSVRDSVRASAQKSGGVPVSQYDMLRTATSEAGLGAAAQDFWSMVVQLWLVEPLAEGETKSRRHRTSLPQFGGGALLNRMTALLDPKTALPHHVVLHRDSRFELTVGGTNDTIAGGEVSDRIYRFHYKQSLRPGPAAPARRSPPAGRWPGRTL